MVELPSMSPEDAAATDAPKPPADKYRRLLSDGLLIAGITLLSYAAAYCFEFGYAEHFGLPTDLIRVSLDMCLRAAAGTLAVLFILSIFLWGHYFQFWNDLKNPNTLFGVIIFVYVICMTGYWLYSAAFGFPGRLGIVIIGTLALLVIATPITLHYFGVKILEEFSIDGVRKRMRPRYLLIAAIIIGLYFCYLFGHASAKRCRSFLITAQRDKLLLRNYGDVYVFKNYDGSKNEITNTITILGLDKVSNLELETITFNVETKPTVEQPVVTKVEPK
jgi:hypothetical protein